jgi:hypothetical protein
MLSDEVVETHGVVVLQHICIFDIPQMCIVLKCWVLLKEEIVNPSFHWIPKIARYDVTVYFQLLEINRQISQLTVIV